MIPLDWTLLTAIALFSIGILGVLTSRNAVRILMGIEIMLNAANLAMVGFAGAYPLAGNPGPVPALLVMTVEASEATVGLAIFLLIAHHNAGVNVDRIHLLKG